MFSRFKYICLLGEKMIQTKFRDIETIYDELKERFRNEEISYEDMKNELQKLVIRDEDNNYWMLGANTGKWYILDKSEWVEKSPYNSETVEEEKKVEEPLKKETLIEQTKKKFLQPFTLVIAAVAVLVIIFLIFFLLKSKPQDTAQGSPTKDDTIKKSSTQTPPSGGDHTKENKTWNLSNEIIQGSSPMKVKESGPIFSEEIDPEIVAIGNALKIRVETLRGSRIKKSGGITTRICEGKFQGFFIKATLTERQDQVIKDEVIILTPSKGTIKIEKNILYSIKNSDYQKFHEDLKNSGIEVVVHPNPEHNTINVQLNVTKFNEKMVEKRFLITNNKVGEIKLDMPIEIIERVLPPPDYIIFKRDIWHNNINYNVYKIFDESRNPLFFIYSQNKKVWGIQVVSNKFKTESGVGIDNTLGDFLIYYSKIKIGKTSTDAPYAFVDKINALFFLQSGEIDFNNNVFPNGTKITWILLGDSPYLE